MLVVDDVDKQVWDLVTNVPSVSKPIAIGSAVVNVIIPGFGTMIAACASSDTVSKVQLVVGLLQFLTSWLLIGWVLSLYWAYLIVMKALNV